MKIRDTDQSEEHSRLVMTIPCAIHAVPSALQVTSKMDIPVLSSEIEPPPTLIWDGID